jgi:hypothetical protein
LVRLELDQIEHVHDRGVALKFMKHNVPPRTTFAKYR